MAGAWSHYFVKDKNGEKSDFNEAAFSIKSEPQSGSSSENTPVGSPSVSLAGDAVSGSTSSGAGPCLNSASPEQLLDLQNVPDLPPAGLQYLMAVRDYLSEYIRENALLKEEVNIYRHETSQQLKEQEARLRK